MVQAKPSFVGRQAYSMSTSLGSLNTELSSLRKDIQASSSGTMYGRFFQRDVTELFLWVYLLKRSLNHFQNNTSQLCNYNSFEVNTRTNTSPNSWLCLILHDEGERRQTAYLLQPFFQLAIIAASGDKFAHTGSDFQALYRPWGAQRTKIAEEDCRAVMVILFLLFFLEQIYI